MNPSTTVPRNAFVDFKELKSRVTILQILERYGLVPTLKRTADRLSGPCPLHKGTNVTQFRVSLSKNCFNCFGLCGRGGNVIDFVSMREGLAFRDAALLLQEWFPSDKTTSGKVAETPATYASSPPLPPNQPPPPNRALAAGSGEEDDGAGENPPLAFQLKSLKHDHPYLTERGLTEATAQSYGLGYCSKGCLRGHIAIPVRNREGVVVGYTGRWPGEPQEDKPKYKVPKEFRKALELFNLDRALHADGSKPLLVVTGVFDCLHLVQLGYPRTVALMDSTMSLRQEVLLRDAVGPEGTVCLLLNPTGAESKGAVAAANRLGSSCRVHALEFHEYGAQADQLGRLEIAALLGKLNPSSL